MICEYNVKPLDLTEQSISRLSGSQLTNSLVLVRERTTPTERPPLVDEVSANFCGQRGVAWSVRRIPCGHNLDRTSLEHSHKTLH
jgi:hypothetical protein